MSKDFYKTRLGILRRIYDHQRESSRKRNHPQPEYTGQELFDWAISQPIFETIYQEWILSGYDRWKTPSVDREKDNLPYTFSNIRLMTWRENNQDAHRKMRNGEIENEHLKLKPVISTDKNLRELEFKSINEAARNTGAFKPNIIACCKGKRKTAGGYSWKYKTEDYVARI